MEHNQQEVTVNYADILNDRIKGIGNNAVTILGDYCQRVSRSIGLDMLETPMVVWCMQERLLALMLTENNMVSYAQRTEVAEVVKILLAQLDRIVERHRQSADAAIRAQVDGLMSYREQALDNLLMRPIFPHMEGDDLTYGGRVPAPIPDGQPVSTKLASKDDRGGP